MERHSPGSELVDFFNPKDIFVNKTNVFWLKAFGAGADFVMMGGMLAGHDQSGGEVQEKNGKKVREGVKKTRLFR